MADDQDSSEAKPVSSNQVHELCKDLTPDSVRVRTNGSEYLAEHLRNTLEALIKTAEENRIEKEDRQLEREHIDNAINEAFSRYNMMDEFISLVEQYEYELKREAASTKMLEFDDLNDE
ncbi:hypothetical protein [Halorussus salinisoli]|uniref:hypothetical protein n=1 Tax=Halorussus salinisoli TaxID=2558242 RepID=UPI0010C1A89F|nr:hypothetical protein [Halorussus salinisoli]